MLLQLSGVNKTYGLRTVLKDVSCNISPGTILLLTGNNGSGKSTLLKIMASLIKPTAGTITSTCKAGKIGYLGHATCIYPQLSAIENLKFWASIHQMPIIKKDLKKILERVNLLQFAYERTGTFSRGMAQRLNFARILLLKPQLILLDEPSTGLDGHSITLLHKEILQAKEAGSSIVWVTHNIMQDFPKAEKIIKLNNKKIEYYGTVTDYKYHYLNESIIPC